MLLSLKTFRPSSDTKSTDSIDGYCRRSPPWVVWPDADLERGHVRVSKTKTGKNRLTPLADALKTVLEEVPEAERKGPLVPVPDGYTAQTWLENIVDRLEGTLPALAEKDLVKWGVWRHTFASLLAQKNVGLDRISAWMGNTPEVCRRHYAQFLPRGGRDGDIAVVASQPRRQGTRQRRP